MNKPEPKTFFEAVQSYPYIDENGRMDLEVFCVILSDCFANDGILSRSPDPRAVYDLLIEVLKDAAQERPNTDDLVKLWIQTQDLVDWSPPDARYYPDKIRTHIHIGGLLLALEPWVSSIGYVLMGVPRSSVPLKYYAWAEQEWTHVYELIDGLHNAVFDVAKETDRKTIKEHGYSDFEALHLAIREGVDLEQATAQLKIRHDAHGQTVSRIEEAITAEFYLEAITLQECLISNCLYNYLKARSSKLKTLTFYELLKRVDHKKSGLSVNDRALFKSIDEWRAKRNTAIHGFIESKVSDQALSSQSFTSYSEITAKEGAELCTKVCEWFEQETVQFLDMKLPRETPVIH